MTFNDYTKSLEDKITKSYEEGVTQDEAERLAAEFLVAQLKVSAELKTRDLDARMRKSGLKAVRASAYLDIVKSSDKKPTEAQIDALINTDKLVSQEQDAFDKAEVERDELERYYDVFANAHVHFRTISKGRFE